MSLRPYTNATAPKNGRVKGSKNKLSAQSMQILDRLLVDWTKHGAAVLRTLRVERPELYAKLALDVASRVTLNGSEIVDDRPQMLIIRWGEPKGPRPPPPPETLEPVNAPPPPMPEPESPQNTPQYSPPRLLTLLPRPDAPA